MYLSPPAIWYELGVTGTSPAHRVASKSSPPYEASPLTILSPSNGPISSAPTPVRPTQRESPHFFFLSLTLPVESGKHRFSLECRHSSRYRDSNTTLVITTFTRYFFLRLI